ncbi:MAG: flagellar basal body-associated FliL family protein [Balneolia bacterium]|nr:flagellar basal body-associated FliL family protein [Balneolia bacterium]
MAKTEKEVDVTDAKEVGPVFLVYGKYFLLVLLLVLQGVVAYAVVDKNYSRAYGVVNSFFQQEMSVYTLDEIIVNPHGSRGQRFLVVQISVEIADSKHIELIDKNMPRIKHHKNRAISSRTVDQLLDFEEREELREELKHMVNREIGSDSVRNLYFTKYVMQ